MTLVIHGFAAVYDLTVCLDPFQPSIVAENQPNALRAQARVDIAARYALLGITPDQIEWTEETR